VAGVFDVPAQLYNQLDMAPVLLYLLVTASLSAQLDLLLYSVELDIDAVYLLAPVLRVDAAL